MTDHINEPDPLVVELTADTSGMIDAVRRAKVSLMFRFHPDLTPPVERAARPRMLPGKDFRESMKTLITQAGESPEEIRRIQAAVLRLAKGHHGTEETTP